MAPLAPGWKAATGTLCLFIFFSSEDFLETIYFRARTPKHTYPQIPSLPDETEHGTLDCMSKKVAMQNEHERDSVTLCHHLTASVSSYIYSHRSTMKKNIFQCTEIKNFNLSRRDVHPLLNILRLSGGGGSTNGLKFRRFLLGSLSWGRGHFQPFAAVLRSTCNCWQKDGHVCR